MIYTTETLREALSKYKKPNDKIHRMIREKKLFPITRGLYTTAPDIRCIIAQSARIINPSNT
jgi:hypothetical protein